MATSFSSREWSRSANVTPRASALGARMTRHAAAALLTFVIGQIWLMMVAIDRGVSPSISVIALALVIAAAIPFARLTERRWYLLGQYSLPSPALTAHYWRDVRRLWLLALTVPALWIGAAMWLIPAI